MNIPALASESTFIELRKYLIVCGIRADNKFRREEHEELPGEENGLYLILIEYELALVLVKTRMIVKGSEHLRLDNSELGRVSHLRI